MIPKAFPMIEAAPSIYVSSFLLMIVERFSYGRVPWGSSFLPSFNAALFGSFRQGETDHASSPL